MIELEDISFNSPKDYDGITNNINIDTVQWEKADRESSFVINDTIIGIQNTCKPDYFSNTNSDSEKLSYNDIYDPIYVIQNKINSVLARQPANGENNRDENPDEVYVKILQKSIKVIQDYKKNFLDKGVSQEIWEKCLEEKIIPEFKSLQEEFNSALFSKYCSKVYEREVFLKRLANQHNRNCQKCATVFSNLYEDRVVNRETLLKEMGREDILEEEKSKMLKELGSLVILPTDYPEPEKGEYYYLGDNAPVFVRVLADALYTTLFKDFESYKEYLIPHIKVILYLFDEDLTVDFTPENEALENDDISYEDIELERLNYKLKQTFCDIFRNALKLIEKFEENLNDAKENGKDIDRFIHLWKVYFCKEIIPKIASKQDELWDIIRKIRELEYWLDFKSTFDELVEKYEGDALKRQIFKACKTEEETSLLDDDPDDKSVDKYKFANDAHRFFVRYEENIIRNYEAIINSPNDVLINFVIRHQEVIKLVNRYYEELYPTLIKETSSDKKYEIYYDWFKEQIQAIEEQNIVLNKEEIEILPFGGCIIRRF